MPISCLTEFGLIDAIEKFDPERATRFEPYAIRRIRGAIIDELRALDWIPRSVRAKARLIERGYAELEASLGRHPGDAELAAHLGIDLSELHAIFSQLSTVNVLALDELLTASIDRSSGVSLGDTLEDTSAVDPVATFEMHETRQRLAQAIELLPEREQTVVTLYYFEGLTLAEIGQVIGVSESRVCQIHARASSSSGQVNGLSRWGCHLFQPALRGDAKVQCQEPLPTAAWSTHPRYALDAGD
jgi:RNA polymerase sigma factor for flagellar operon FliA